MSSVVRCSLTGRPLFSDNCVYTIGNPHHMGVLIRENAFFRRREGVIYSYTHGKAPWRVQTGLPFVFLHPGNNYVHRSTEYSESFNMCSNIVQHLLSVQPSSPDQLPAALHSKTRNYSKSFVCKRSLSVTDFGGYGGIVRETPGADERTEMRVYKNAHLEGAPVTCAVFQWLTLAPAWACRRSAGFLYIWQSWSFLSKPLPISRFSSHLIVAFCCFTHDRRCCL